LLRMVKILMRLAGRGWQKVRCDRLFITHTELHAQRVLGQNSKIVHRVFAKKAQRQLPSLEEYEEAIREAKKRGRIVVMGHEAEVRRVT
jgi:hypothetical protein